jgi:site-specific recombinase XerD
MASLVARKDSQFWWIKFVEPTTGKRVFKSTSYPRADPIETKKARALESAWTAKEKSTAANVANPRNTWVEWVPDFLKRHARGRTLVRYQTAWEWIFTYLREIGVTRPSELTYRHCLGFLDWRTKKVTRLHSKTKKKKLVKLNTALNDIKVLRIVMGQAVKLGIAQANPCFRLGVQKEEAKEKPELTDADIADIRTALKGEDKWMHTAFEIAINTGCRLSETRIKLSNIDFERGTILFESPKGGRTRAFTTPLPAAIKPMLLKIKDRGDAYTLTLPPVPGKDWWSFFKRVKRSDLCFHSTRVTFVTRLARAGVPQSIAMRLVNHSSVLVHKIYQRLGVEDVREYQHLAKIPGAAST